MSELAYNYKGRRFTPPPEATFWRVRRIREGQRGQLEVVRGVDGRPLVVPIDISVEAFRVAVAERIGRYRLDALDEHELEVADVDAAYVTVPMTPAADDAPDAEEPAPRVEAGLRNAAQPAMAAVMPVPGATVTAPYGTWPALPLPMAMSGTEYLLAEALRGQALMFQSLTAALAQHGATSAASASQMMGAAAELLRAADGAGLTRRAVVVEASAPPVAPVPPSVPPSPPVGPAGPATEAPRNAAPAGDEDEDQDQDDEDDDQDGEDQGEDDRRAEARRFVARAYGHGRRARVPYDAREAGDDQDDNDQDDGGQDDDGQDDSGEDEGASTDADIMSRLMTLADKVQGALAPVADVARLVVGGFGGGLRNAPGEADEGDGEGDADEGETVQLPAPAPAIPAHLRISHMQAIGYELGAQGSRFRRIVMAMEPREQRALTDHLCTLPLDEAVADVRAKLASIPPPRPARPAPMDPAQVVMPPPVVVVEAAPVAFEAERGLGEVEPTVASGSLDDAAPKASDEQGAAPPTAPTLTPVTDVAPEASGPAPAALEVTPTEPTTTKATASAASALVAKAAAPPADLQAQMLQIVRHLSMPEILRVQGLASKLSAEDRAAWLTRLSTLSPKAAAAAIRAELAKR